MKNKRQMRIIEIISREEISTQEELSQRLAQMGEHVTQATVSRDIRELNLIKIPGAAGKPKYAAGANPAAVSGRLIRVFMETVTAVESSGNIVVIRTISGSANAAAELIDSLGWEEMLACLAGDNTILVVVKEGYSGQELAVKFRELVR